MSVPKIVEITRTFQRLCKECVGRKAKNVSGFNRLLAAKPSRDLLFIKLWAATLRMTEMEKAC